MMNRESRQEMAARKIKFNRFLENHKNLFLPFLPEKENFFTKYSV